MKADGGGDGSDGACVAYMATSGCGWTSNWSCPGQGLGASGAAQLTGGVDRQAYHCCCELRHYADVPPESSLWTFPDAPVLTTPSNNSEDRQGGAKADLEFAQNGAGAVHNSSVSATDSNTTGKTVHTDDGGVGALMERVADLEALQKADGADEEGLSVHSAKGAKGDGIDALMKRVADLELAKGAATSAHHSKKTHGASNTSNTSMQASSAPAAREVEDASPSRDLLDRLENVSETVDAMRENAPGSTKGSLTKRGGDASANNEGEMLERLDSVSQTLDAMRDAFETSVNTSRASGL